MVGEVFNIDQSGNCIKTDKIAHDSEPFLHRVQWAQHRIVIQSGCNDSIAGTQETLNHCVQTVRTVQCENDLRGRGHTEQASELTTAIVDDLRRVVCTSMAAAPCRRRTGAHPAINRIANTVRFGKTGGGVVEVHTSAFRKIRRLAKC